MATATRAAIRDENEVLRRVCAALREQVARQQQKIYELVLEVASAEEKRQRTDGGVGTHDIKAEVLPSSVSSPPKPLTVPPASDPVVSGAAQSKPVASRALNAEVHPIIDAGQPNLKDITGRRKPKGHARRSSHGVVSMALELATTNKKPSVTIPGLPDPGYSDKSSKPQAVSPTRTPRETFLRVHYDDKTSTSIPTQKTVTAGSLRRIAILRKLRVTPFGPVAKDVEAYQLFIGRRTDVDPDAEFLYKIDDHHLPVQMLRPANRRRLGGTFRLVLLRADEESVVKRLQDVSELTNLSYDAVHNTTSAPTSQSPSQSKPSPSTISAAAAAAAEKRRQKGSALADNGLKLDAATARDSQDGQIYHKISDGSSHRTRPDPDEMTQSTPPDDASKNEQKHDLDSDPLVSARSDSQNTSQSTTPKGSQTVQQQRDTNVPNIPGTEAKVVESASSDKKVKPKEIQRKKGQEFKSSVKPTPRPQTFQTRAVTASGQHGAASARIETCSNCHRPLQCLHGSARTAPFCVFCGVSNTAQDAEAEEHRSRRDSHGGDGGGVQNAGKNRTLQRRNRGDGGGVDRTGDSKGGRDIPANASVDHDKFAAQTAHKRVKDTYGHDGGAHRRPSRRAESKGEVNSALADSKRLRDRERVYSFTSLFGTAALRIQYDVYPVSSLNGTKVVGLYFSAASSGPCRRFTPLLRKTYRDMRAQGRSIEIVLVPTDETREHYETQRSEMPWPALDFNLSLIKSKLHKRFGIFRAPSLVFLNERGKVLCTSGRKEILKHGASAYPFTRERIEQLMGTSGDKTSKTRAHRRAQSSMSSSSRASTSTSPRQSSSITPRARERAKAARGRGWVGTEAENHVTGVQEGGLDPLELSCL